MPRRTGTSSSRSTNANRPRAARRSRSAGKSGIRRRTRHTRARARRPTGRAPYAQRLATDATGAVGVLLTAVLLILTFWPGSLPLATHLTELLWANSHYRLIVLVVLALLAAIALTVVAAIKVGRHRPVLVAMWIGFVAMTFVYAPQQAALLGRIIWWRINR